jgi:hypothetical protein
MTLKPTRRALMDLAMAVAQSLIMLVFTRSAGRFCGYGSTSTSQALTA